MTLDETRATAWPRASWPALLAVGLVSRIVVVSLGMLAPLGNPADLASMGCPPDQLKRMTETVAELDTPARRPLTGWYRWDALWYLLVARDGYEYSPERQSNVAFLPMLPTIMAAGSAAGLDVFWVGLIVPNLAFAAGLVAFGRIAARITGDDGMAWRSCLLLISFPTSFFFSAPYHESLGFALSAWGILAWIDRRPLAAAAFSGLSSAARLASVAVSAAIVAEWLDDVVRRRKPRPWAWPVALAGGLGVTCFFLYLGYRLGDPLAHLKAHKEWGRQPGLVGIKTFATQAVLYCWQSRPIAMWVFASAMFVLRPWIAPYFPSIELAGWGRSKRVALLAVLAIGVLAIGWATMPIPLKVSRRLISILDIHHDNLAFFLFLFLGLSAWARRGPFWGCLILIPIGLAASSGTPISIGRVVLTSFPAFIEMAELCGKRLLFVAIVVAGAICQFVYLCRFVRLDFVG